MEERRIRYSHTGEISYTSIYLNIKSEGEVGTDFLTFY